MNQHTNGDKVTLEELKFMLEAQEQLNIKYSGDEWRNNITMGQAKFALHEEVAEFINELRPAWKWWGKVEKLDRDKAIFEYIDVLHFAMLIALFNFYPDELETFLPVGGDMGMNHIDMYNQFSKAIQRFLIQVDQHNIQDVVVGLYNIINIGAKILDLKDGEVFEAYLKKNALNHKRVENGALDGSYDKSKEESLSL